MGYIITDIRSKLPTNKLRLDRGEKIPVRKGPIKRLVLHCTDWDDKGGENVYDVAKYDVTPSPNHHLSKDGCFTITYTYFIENVNEKVTIYQCLDHHIKSWHVGQWWNDSSLGVAVMKKGEDPAPDSYKAAIWLLTKLTKDLAINIPDIVFHRELQFTGWVLDSMQKKALRKTCPGLVWDPGKTRELIVQGLEKESTVAIPTHTPLTKIFS